MTRQQHICQESHSDHTVSRATPEIHAYGASKAALNPINKALNLDLRERLVECLLIQPGYVRTAMTGEGG